MIHVILGLALMAQSAIHAGGSGSQALAMPPAPFCTSGACTFTWSGSSGTAITTYNAGFANLSSSHAASSVTLDGSGHAQVAGFSIAGARYTGSTSDTAQIVFAAAAGADNSLVKAVCVRADGTNDGYCLFPCYSDGSGHWARLCTYKNGSEFQQGPLSSYDPTVDNTAKIVVSGTSTVTIQLYWNGTLIDTATDSTSPIAPGGNPGFWSGDGSHSAAQQQFGTFQDH